MIGMRSTSVSSGGAGSKMNRQAREGGLRPWRLIVSWPIVEPIQSENSGIIPSVLVNANKRHCQAVSSLLGTDVTCEECVHCVRLCVCVCCFSPLVCHNDTVSDGFSREAECFPSCSYLAVANTPICTNTHTRAQTLIICLSLSRLFAFKS